MSESEYGNPESRITALIDSATSPGMHLPTWWAEAAGALDSFDEAFEQRLHNDLASLREHANTNPHLLTAFKSVSELGNLTHHKVKHVRRTLSSCAGDPSTTDALVQEMKDLADSAARYGRRTYSLFMDSMNLDIGVAD